MGEEYTHNQDRSIQYQASDAVFQIHNYNLDLKANSIYLVGEDCYAEEEEPGVEFLMANRFIKNLNIIQRKSDQPILIIMKTCGGDWTEGMAIYDAIKACPNHIVILNYTHARSMSSLIFLAADKRVMMPHATYMFHAGSFGFEGTHKQAMTEFIQEDVAFGEMLDVYVDALKAKGKFKHKSKKKIREWLVKEMDKKEEVYFTAKEAVEYGFADEVFGADGTYDWKKLVEFEE